MIGQAGFLADRLVLFVRDDRPVGLPKVAEDETLLVGVRYVAPELFTRRNTPPADHASDDLPRCSANGQPYPPLSPFGAHERPQLVEFECDRLRLLGLDEGIAKRWRRLGFF